MTRYYLTRNASAVTIPVWPGWDHTRAEGFPNRFTLAETKVDGQAPQLRQGGQHPPSTTATSASSQHVLAAALPAGTLAGTLEGAAIGFRVSTTSVSLRPRLRLAVVSPDGTTERGVLLDATHPGLIGTATTYNAHTWSAQALTPVTAQAGDRLVLTVGSSGANTSTSGAFRADFYDGGETGTADIPANHPPGSSTTGMAPWVDITWSLPPNPPTGLTQTDAAPDSVTVEWTAPATGPAPTGYELRVDGAAPTPVTGTTATVPALAESTDYLVEVRSVNAVGTSAWVGITATTDDLPTYDRRWWTHHLAVRLGLDPIAVQPVVVVETSSDGDTWTPDAALSSALAGYTVTYGREDATSSLDPLTAGLTFAAARLTGPIELGTRLRLRLCDDVADALGLDADARVRFTGEVTDPTGTTTLVKASAVGRLGRAYRLPVPPELLPGDQAHGRVERLLYGTGLPLDVGTIDHDPAELEPATSAATLSAHMGDVEKSTTGRLVEQPTGRLEWHGPDHRRGVTPAVSLAAGELLADLSWSQRLADTVNTLEVTTPAAGAVTVTDPHSADPVTGHGPYAASLSTLLTTLEAARSLGSLIVGRRATPAWRLPALTVDLTRTATPAHLPALLELRHSDRLQLPNLPAAVPVPASVFVEGWTETATPREWRLSVAVTDPLLSGAALRWLDVPETTAYQWSDIDADLTWLDTARIEYPANLLGWL